MASEQQQTVLGRVTSVFGVKGWVKVYSFTDPLDNIFGYKQWTLRQAGKQVPVKLVEGKRHGKGLIALFEGVTDRDQAAAYCGADILVAAEELPALPEGEYYWYQLEGLRVETPQGQRLGRVHHLMETGSNDVLVVRPDGDSIDDRERLVPYLPDDVVKNIDLQAGLIVVDWDPEF
ncbi:ribosome maturation factor RimM [Marinobacteraceae bacterium S3BR75-40.1]